MSRTLCCEFVIETEKRAVYWWPLIFKAMEEHAFHFSAPDYPQGIGQYYYERVDNPSDADSRAGSFRTLWDEIYSETSEVLVVFWSSDNDPFNLDLTLSSDQEAHHVRLTMYFAGADLTGLRPKQIQKRLSIILNCAKRLYETCKPCIGEMYWESAGVKYAPWVSFGTLPEKPSPERPVHEGPERTWIRQVLPSGDRMYLFDPVPIPQRKGGWKFISLLETLPADSIAKILY